MLCLILVKYGSISVQDSIRDLWFTSVKSLVNVYNAATLHTDDNNVILIENVLLIINFLVLKLDDNEIVLLIRGVADGLSSNGKCFALA